MQKTVKFMGRKNACLWAIVAVLGVTQWACSDAGRKKKVIYTEVHALDVVDAVQSKDGGDDQAASREAFKLTVYPIVTKYCVNCHGSTFAGPEYGKAFDALIATGKVNLSDPDQSGLIARLKTDRHNCWSDCDKNSQDIKAAIEKWAGMVKDGGGAVTGGTDSAVMTSDANIGVKLINPKDLPLGPGTIVFEAESAQLKAPFAISSDAAASGGKYVVAQTGGRAITPEEAEKDTSLGTIRYSFATSDDAAANYTVYAHVLAPSEASNSFHVRIDDGALLTWDVRPLDTKWQWVQVAQRVTPTDDQNVTPRTFTLDPGNHTIEIIQRENGVKIDEIAITNDPATIQPKLEGIKPTPLTQKTLEYDLSKIVGAPARFSVVVNELNDKAYVFSKPTLITDSKSVHVAGIRVYLNGKTAPEYATYTLVDEVVAPPFEELSPAALVVLQDQGPLKDKISFGFDILEQAQDANDQ